MQETKHVVYKTALGEQLKVECLSCGKQVLAPRKTWEQTAISKKWEEMEEELNKCPHEPRVPCATVGGSGGSVRLPVQYRSQETPMIEFDPREAQVEKWKRGQEKYGPGSLPVCPLAHCYEELIDALNYLDQARSQGEITEEDHQSMTGIVRTAAYWTRGKHFQVEKK